MARIDRQYFKRRALQEIACSKRAGPIEAKIAHAKLAGLHLRRCAAFEAHKTPECLGCPLAFICSYRLAAVGGSSVNRRSRETRILNRR
ncbi:hypothetical protein [Sphingopyxis fribergensis]